MNATTTTAEPTASAAPVVRPRDHGEASWFLNSLVTTVVARAETGGAYGICEHLLTAAGNAPMHVQPHEDEAFYVLDGEIEFVVDGRSAVVGPGGYALVPRGTRA